MLSLFVITLHKDQMNRKSIMFEKLNRMLSKFTGSKVYTDEMKE